MAFLYLSIKNTSESAASQQAPSISSSVRGEPVMPGVLALFGSASQMLLRRDGAEPGAAASKQAPGQLVPHVSCAIMFLCRILDDIHGAK